MQSYQKVMTQEVASDVYDILVKECGANANHKEQFIYAMLDSTPFREYRFCGDLGFGGKYWADYWEVRYYGGEDKTDERETIVLQANTKLQELKEEVLAEYSHDKDCARKEHGMSECTCFKSM